MKVLSLFDGLSGCRIALERVGITPTKYYASEIDKYAITVAQANYPDTVQLGSVTDWEKWDIDWSEIDLVTSGFPCQAWSVAGKQQGDKDERGMLFWTMLDVMKKVLLANPGAKFLIENVKMKKEFEQYITKHTEESLGEVYKTLINSALVSAQNRNRYYWTNFPVMQPEDKGLVLADVIEDGFVDRDNAHCIDANYHKGGNLKSYFEKHRRQLVFNRPCEPKQFNQDSICHHAATATDIKGNESIKRVYAETGKAPTLTTMGGGHREPKVLCGAIRGRYIVDGKRQDHKMLTAGLTEQRLEIRTDEKTNSLTTVQKDNVVVALEESHYSERSKAQIKKNSKMPHQKSVAVCSNSNMTGSGVNVLTTDNLSYRKLTPLECERLQTLPDNYTAHVSNTQRYKMIGNGFTVDVIAHIFDCANLKDEGF